jgi:hypothetical protein
MVGPQWTAALTRVRAVQRFFYMNLIDRNAAIPADDDAISGVGDVLGVIEAKNVGGERADPGSTKSPLSLPFADLR